MLKVLKMLRTEFVHKEHVSESVVLPKILGCVYQHRFLVVSLILMFISWEVFYQRRFVVVF